MESDLSSLFFRIFRRSVLDIYNDSLELEALMQQTRFLATTPPARIVESQKPVEVVFDFVLEPK